jgi:DNA-binding LytR/AlgR family response regulator
MQPLRTLVVDDEPYAHELMEKYVNMMPELQLAGHCWDVVEAFKALHASQIDLMLLDIKMPDINGIDFLKKLKDPPLIIFTTAYSEYAIEGYELNVVDYLLKPFSYERFEKAIHKAISISSITTEMPNTAEASAPENTGVQNPAAEGVLFVRSDGKLIKIELSKLIYIESLKDYLQLFTVKERIIIYGTMINMEGQLSGIPFFLRVNKSYMVNIQYITEVEGNIIKLDAVHIPIGKTYKDKVHKYLNKFKLI